ncbi:MAG: hypothetical protein JO093_18595 [Acidobacteria bacterium]|nr:hypothetical protein [Acidobacteriota bacterium]MBV9068193.1 hypothetical protein [Acidobacteriota bacterium]MBV9187632.1 hypothetical protein [Acidobacteriota bacterium]
MVRSIPHAGYAHAYGGAADHLYTAIDRLVLWFFSLVVAGDAHSYRA